MALDVRKCSFRVKCLLFIITAHLQSMAELDENSHVKGHFRPLLLI